MAIVDTLIVNNERFAASLTETEKSLPLPPGKKYAIVACMDARLHPPAALGVSLGDAHIIRNAGGSARDAIRSLTISQQLLGTEEIVIIKHTDCGMLTFTNDDIHVFIEKNLGSEAAKDKKDYLPFPDLDQAIRDDVEFLKNSPLISEKAKQSISGFVYHVESGKIRRVV